MKKISFTLSLALLGFGFSAYSQTNVFDDIIAPSPNHTYLEQALLQEGLEGALQDNSATLTVFAPNDNAFTNLATALGTDVNGLLALPNLSDILTYHVLGTTVNSGGISNGAIVQPLSTTNTLKLTLTSESDVFVNQAQVISADNPADNGVVHVTNAILLPYETVADVAIDNGFSSLVTAVATAELLPALTDPLAKYTVFAPTNQAFDDAAAALGTDINGLLALENLQDILLYHVLDFEAESNIITNGLVVEPISPSNSLKLSLTESNDVFVNQAQVTLADVNADNGVVHAIDAVVLPNETVVDIAIDNGFTSLVAAVTKAELLSTLTNPFEKYTVFAPTDDAFDAAATALGSDLTGLLNLSNLADILTYHVIGSEVESSAINNGDIVQPVSMTNSLKLTKTEEGLVYINQAQVTLADVNSDNGVVHVLDALVLPSETIIDAAIDNSLTSLTSAVLEAELIPALSNPFTQLTAFAPTNEAFDDLADALGTDIAGVLAHPDLRNILLYHVLDGEVVSTDLMDGDVTMLNNQSVTVDLSSGVMINTSNVTVADVQVDNGVVHVIDKVLVPALASINENEQISIDVYPNPASEKIFISGDKSMFTQAIIYDLNGKVVLNTNISNNTINVESLESGTYVIGFQNNNNLITKKISIF